MCWRYGQCFSFYVLLNVYNPFIRTNSTEDVRGLQKHCLRFHVSSPWIMIGTRTYLCRRVLIIESNWRNIRRWYIDKPCKNKRNCVDWVYLQFTIAMLTGNACVTKQKPGGTMYPIHIQFANKHRKWLSYLSNYSFITCNGKLRMLEDIRN